MNKLCTVLLLMTAALSPPAWAYADTPVRFTTVDVYLDSPDRFAAWQFELTDRNASMTVVGVENGDSPAFSDAPYYDRDAVARGVADRIIVADFSLADAARLPSGRTRIATLHLMLPETGEPDFELRLVTATTREGDAVDATISLDTEGER